MLRLLDGEDNKYKVPKKILKQLIDLGAKTNQQIKQHQLKRKTVGVLIMSQIKMKPGPKTYLQLKHQPVDGVRAQENGDLRRQIKSLFQTLRLPLKANL
jgi:hypothetical protein